MSAELTLELAEELIHRSYESSDLDYKETFDDSTGAWMEFAKDVYGMANNGGGYIVLGVKDGSFVRVGLDEARIQLIRDVELDEPHQLMLKDFELYLVNAYRAFATGSEQKSGFFLSSALDGVNRFQDSKHACAYLGLVCNEPLVWFCLPTRSIG